MIWLELANAQGQELYFDAWKRERSRTGAGELVSGLIGDGSYEGEVLVELHDEECQLTFVDRFLDPDALRAFLDRVPVDRLRRALHENLADMVKLELGRRRRDGGCAADRLLTARCHCRRDVA